MVKIKKSATPKVKPKKLKDLIVEAKSKAVETKVIHYVIQTLKDKRVISNTELYHYAKDGGVFTFLYEPSESEIEEIIK